MNESMTPDNTRDFALSGPVEVRPWDSERGYFNDVGTRFVGGDNNASSGKVKKEKKGKAKRTPHKVKKEKPTPKVKKEKPTPKAVPLPAHLHRRSTSLEDISSEWDLEQPALYLLRGRPGRQYVERVDMS